MARASAVSTGLAERGTQHKYMERINISRALQESERREADGRIRMKEKADRATSEQVLDPRTRMILFKMLNKGLFYEINGCLSTGKEANVYHAKTQTGEEFAIKIYKTSILVFKDRDRYVTGEFRFRRGYCKSNPRKMVKLWAEKELRNLLRLRMAGIPCPEPVSLRAHVLVMSFIGEDGLNAPRLKDTQLSTERHAALYAQLIGFMRTMYHQCRLVHADLSEYNLLYYKKGLVVIDVSQSVEHDHPHALAFLRMDCKNVCDYFRKQGVDVMTARQLFNYVIDLKLSTPELLAEYVRAALEANAAGAASNASLVDDEVFMSAYIPRTLDEVLHVERDVFDGLAGQDAFYATVTGLRAAGERDEAAERRRRHEAGEDESAVPAPAPKQSNKKQAMLAQKQAQQAAKRARTQPTGAHVNAASDDGDEAGEGDDDDEGEGESGDGDGDEADADDDAVSVASSRAAFHLDMSLQKTMSKQEWKKYVKEMNRKRRGEKIPKSLKKRHKILAKRERA